MADWKVIADRITILPHPNADSLALAKIGPFQLVVGKANGYQSGDVVILAPERSVLPDDLKGDYVNSETGVSYLSGDEHNRVKRIRLRGEFSEGVTIPHEYVLHKMGLTSMADLALKEDLSERLGIIKYEPPVPETMRGQLTPIVITSAWKTHDVEQFQLYRNEFVVGEEVVVTEKMHGSQGCFYRTPDGTCYVSSKSFTRQELSLMDSPTNLYWIAARQSQIFERIAAEPALADASVQVFGEVIPCQKGYGYGATRPQVLLYRVVVNGEELSLSSIKERLSALFEIFVPVLYEGTFDPQVVVDLSKGSETFSGRQLHIREGVVLSPAHPRLSHEGFPLYVKVINPKYKDTDEAFS